MTERVNITEIKQKLMIHLGKDKAPNYMKQLKLFFEQKLTKEELDGQVLGILGRRVALHNLLVMAIINNAQCPNPNPNFTNRIRSNVGGDPSAGGPNSSESIHFNLHTSPSSLKQQSVSSFQSPAMKRRRLIDPKPSLTHPSLPFSQLESYSSSLSSLSSLSNPSNPSKLSSELYFSKRNLLSANYSLNNPNNLANKLLQPPSLLQQQHSQQQQSLLQPQHTLLQPQLHSSSLLPSLQMHALLFQKVQKLASEEGLSQVSPRALVLLQQALLHYLSSLLSSSLSSLLPKEEEEENTLLSSPNSPNSSKPYFLSPPPHIQEKAKEETKGEEMREEERREEQFGEEKLLLLMREVDSVGEGKEKKKEKYTLQHLLSLLHSPHPDNNSSRVLLSSSIKEKLRMLQ